MQVAQWGNSLAVRLPVVLVQELGIADGDELELRPVPKIPGRPASATVERKPRKLELLQAALKYRAPRPADIAFDRDEANEMPCRSRQLHAFHREPLQRLETDALLSRPR